MNVALRNTRMTREEFFPWAEAQDARYEFDGVQPVAMTGGTQRHNLIAFAIHRALHTRLKGSACRPFGMDAGIATAGEAIRYPDALVACTKFEETARVVPGVVVVFEVISPASGRTDRIDKVREYRAVPGILRYVILEHTSVGLTSFQRASGGQDWTAVTLTAGETLALPEIGIEIPVAELYEDVTFDDAAAQAS